jgi:hypothetical protein
LFVIEETVLAEAAVRFGFTPEQAEFRLYVGNFADAGSEQAVREWCATQVVGAGQVLVIGDQKVVAVVREVLCPSTIETKPCLRCSNCSTLLERPSHPGQLRMSVVVANVRP